MLQPAVTFSWCLFGMCIEYFWLIHFFCSSFSGEEKQTHFERKFEKDTTSSKSCQNWVAHDALTKIYSCKNIELLTFTWRTGCVTEIIRKYYLYKWKKLSGARDWLERLTPGLGSKKEHQAWSWKPTLGPLKSCLSSSLGWKCWRYGEERVYMKYEKCSLLQAHL